MIFVVTSLSVLPHAPGPQRVLWVVVFGDNRHELRKGDRVALLNVEDPKYGAHVAVGQKEENAQDHRS